MSLNSSRRYGLSPDQFEMAQMIGLIALAAVLYFLLGCSFLLGNSMLGPFVYQFAVCLSVVVLGLRYIATKQPALVRARWHPTCMIVFLFLPQMMPWVVFRFTSSHAMAGLVVDPTMNFLMATTLLCMVYMWVWSRGYWASGVTDASFREGLLAALKKLDLPYEESDAVIRLPTVGADLHAKVIKQQAAIWVKPHKFAPLLEEIVKEMNDYYRSSNVPANKSFVRYVVIAATSWMVLVLMFLVMGSCLGYFRMSDFL